MTHDEANLARLRLALVAARNMLRDVRSLRQVSQDAIARAIQIADEALDDGDSG